MDPAEFIPRSVEEKFLDHPYKDRWKCLQSVIVKLYMECRPGGKSMTMGQVAAFMNEHYSFPAA